MSNTFLDEQIDGQAFMLLNLPTVQQFLRLKIGAAIRLCHIIERVKLCFFLGYCGRDDEDDDDDEEDEDDGEGEEEEGTEILGESLEENDVVETNGEANEQTVEPKAITV